MEIAHRRNADNTLKQHEAVSTVGYERTSPVSGWFDAEGMVEADLSSEIVGLKLANPGSGAERSPSDRPNETPGYLFIGDDGDSLWFWPDGIELAFRFEKITCEAIRASLPESVDRFISQGALVFCYNQSSTAAVLEFPQQTLKAA